LKNLSSLKGTDKGLSWIWKMYVNWVLSDQASYGNEWFVYRVHCAAYRNSDCQVNKCFTLGKELMHRYIWSIKGAQERKNHAKNLYIFPSAQQLPGLINCIHFFFVLFRLKRLLLIFLI
jgi:hypothetical protein